MHPLDFVGRRECIVQMIPLPFVLCSIVNQYIVNECFESYRLSSKIKTFGIIKDQMYWKFNGKVRKGNDEYLKLVHVDSIQALRGDWMLIRYRYSAYVWNQKELIELSDPANIVVCDHELFYVRTTLNTRRQAMHYDVDTKKSSIIAHNVNRMACIGNQLTLFYSDGTCRLYGSKTKYNHKGLGLYKYENRIFLIDAKELHANNWSYQIESHIQAVYAFGHLLVIHANAMYVWDLKHLIVTKWDTRTAQYYVDDDVLYQDFGWIVYAYK